MRNNTFLFLYVVVISFFNGCQREESPIEQINSKPEIIELSSNSDSLLISSVAYLSCIAKDTDDDSLIITWHAKKGSFINGNSGESVQYLAPSSPGSDTIKVVADDGKQKTEKSIELFVGVLPSSPKLLKPENGKEDVNLSVSLSWSKIKYAKEYELEVSTDKLFKNFVYSRKGLKQNNYELNGLSINSVYYWRVRSKNTFGISKWSEIFSFKTVAPPKQPELLTPLDNEVDIDINHFIKWKSVFNVVSYSLQISESPSFESILINRESLIDTSFQVYGLKNLTKYYWRVKAKNLYGESDWSVISSFSTIGTVPDIPAILSPFNYQKNVPHSVTLKWNESKYADSYSIQLSEDSLFNSVIVDTTGLIETSFQLSELKNTQKYFWRVQTKNKYGISEWSETFLFVTKLTEPEITYPFDNSADISPTTILNWTKIDKAETYSIEVSLDSTFSKIFYSENGIKDTSAQVSGLNTFTKYYWRVRSENNLATSSWSSVKSFNVTGYFYKGYDYGNQAVYHPIYVLLSGGFDMIQVGDKRDIKNFPYKIAAENIWRNLSNPFQPISRYGWWNFIKDQVLPLSLSKRNAQFFPNYTLHLIGGGMEYAALKEWYEYNNYSAPGWLSAATVMGYHLVNEIAENGNYVGDDVDPIADIYIFDIGGILLFTSESVKRFFAEDLNLADWSQQPSFSIRNGELHNNGQFFSIRWKFPFTDSWYAFYYFGTNGVGGLSYKFKDGTGLSVGFGLRASDLILLDEKTNKKTLGLVGNLGLFYDKNNSLLASLSVTIKTDYMVNVNIYPGLIKMGSISPGLWGAYGQNGNVILGFTFSWLPFGFANSLR